MFIILDYELPAGDNYIFCCNSDHLLGLRVAGHKFNLRHGGSESCDKNNHSHPPCIVSGSEDKNSNPGHLVRNRFRELTLKHARITDWLKKLPIILKQYTFLDKFRLLVYQYYTDYIDLQN